METNLYISPNRELVFIAHPRTASTSLRECLLQSGWELVGSHHQVVPSVIGAGMIVCSVVREPFDWFSSFYFYETDGKVDFDAWLLGFLARGGHHTGCHPYLQSNGHDAFFGLEYTDWILFYDHLQVGLDYICERFDMEKFKLPFHQRRNYGKVNAFTATGSYRLRRERKVLIAQYERLTSYMHSEHKILFGAKK